MKRGALVVLLLCLMLFGNRALAQRLTVDLALGSYWPCPADLHLRQGSFGTDLWLYEVPFHGRSLDTPLYYVVRLRREWPNAAVQGLALELEFTHAKAYAAETEVVRVGGRWKGSAVQAEARFREYLQSFSLSHGHNLLFVNCLLWLGDVARERFGCRAGIGLAVPHVEDRVDSRWVQKYQLAGLCFQVGFVVEVRLGRNWAVQISPRWSRARLSRMDCYRGTIATVLDGFHLDAGVSVDLHPRRRGASQG